jgi:hypothetical protein
MSVNAYSVPWVIRLVCLCVCLATVGPAIGQDARALDSFRVQYDVMMSNFERMFAAQGNVAGQQQARAGREAMLRLTHDELAKVYSQTRVPDLSVAAIASGYLASQAESRRFQQKSLPLPGAPELFGQCVSPTIPLDSAGRYALLIIKEVANSILAAATFVCTQDILGNNGSLACVPLAIASDIANGFFDVAQFCAGEFTANQVDGNYNRLQHIHDDLGTGISTIVNNDNANTTTIVNNDNANRAAIINNDNANKTAIINNDNANRDVLIGEIRALGCEIVRLLNTPEGRRASAILACSAQPGFPYNFPQK